MAGTLPRFHTFLLNHEGSLSSAAEEIPHIRNHIENLPKTTATFRAPDAKDNPQAGTEPIHFEFCKAWPMPEDYGPTGRRKRYVNPKYAHAHRYSDLQVECRCGARFVRNYEDEQSPLDAKSAHADSCLPHWRLRARADMSEQRWRMIQRLSWLGWKGIDMGHRFGVTENHVGSYVRDYHFTLREAFETYRETAARTCAYLITHDDAGLEELADIYGHHTKSIRDWMKQHTAYEASYGGGWEHDPTDIETPGFESETEFEWDPEAMTFVES